MIQTVRKPIIDRNIAPPSRRPRSHSNIFVVLALIAGIIVAISAQCAYSPPKTSEPTIPARIAYTEHEPILITGNTLFASKASSEGWPGDGTPGNPYVIEGYEIDAGGLAWCIHIESTDVHFIVRDCYLHDASYKYDDGAAIRFYDVSYGTVENCSVERSGRFGFLAWDSSHISFKNCTSHIAPIGIYLPHCHHITVAGSSFDNSGASGQLGYKYGISIYNSDNVVAEDNKVWDYADNGLVTSASSNLFLCHNTLNGSSTGINLAHAVHFTIVANNTVLNSSVGVHVNLSNYNWFADNRIENSTGYGMWLTGTSTGNRVWNNSFLFNNPSGTQARDDVGTNFWNGTESGNFWSDWTTPDVSPADGIVDNPYVLDGDVGAMDYYPLAPSLTPIPEFNSPVIVIGITIMIVATFMASRGHREKRP